MPRLSKGVRRVKFFIEGGRPLSGTISVAANKNAVLPMMAAALLADYDCYLENVPAIADVFTMADILCELGAQVDTLDEARMRINCRGVTSFHPSEQLVERLRA